ncbi:hemocyte protein-glutamine gamma-glutamyltransferase-like [Plakobranchus ocellatus]|uniref:protein-glutamine gamma-glutamyltransferase n=1 Tax=Plakobranchus ocellatus TaxID=259542 RepID=A0AAV4D0K7_9GAST|nr:hemocyte protein-glutamine gamma-glutamyltransferase-like [Plakobranchus ocellatus]
MNFHARNSAGSFRDPYSGANYHVYGPRDLRESLNGYDEHLSRSPRPQPPLRKPDFSNVLTVTQVDFLVAENSHAHHTDKFEISQNSLLRPQLVVRRGQQFVMRLDFSKKYNINKDDVKLVFEAGENPNSINGTYVEFMLSDRDFPRQWGAKILSDQGTYLIVSVMTPPTLYVGKWDFSVDVVEKDDSSGVDVYKYEHDDPIYVIFNPWCKEDAVYMSNENLLKEYVLNETGFVYMGTKDSITQRPWNFGQFESVVLDCAMYLLDQSDIKWEARGNSTLVVRKLSAMINSQDDNGILTGRWGEPYKDGRSPLSWTGSVKILEKFLDTKKPVKYGQCWVFSGVSTSICRALGIPARSVTNFVSAHDTDGSVTIDSIYDCEGNRLESTGDSVWNFHVWNEAWMARSDLPEGFGGWQAFDATPQETSDGIYCCGPASVQAVKQGEVHLPYDAAFLFAEVNADRMSWVTNITGKMECVDCCKHEIGKNISTKSATGAYREDVTGHYKPEEGSAEERSVVLKANQIGSTRPGIYKKSEDVSFSIEHDAKNTWMGGDFEVILRMRNKSKDIRTVVGRLSVSSMYYTGELADKLKVEPFEAIRLTASQEAYVKVTVTAQDYDKKLKDCCMLDLTVWASVLESGQCFTATPNYRLRKPHLTIKAPKHVNAGEEFHAELSFSNPLNNTLTGCYVEVDGLTRPLKFRLGNVTPKGTLLTTLPIVPKKVGQMELIAIFNSDQLEDINASLPIFIRAN